MTTGNLKTNERKRLILAALPGIILFLGFLSYFFIQYNTFYATFALPQYREQLEEIIIIRGFDPFDKHLTTGLLITDVKDLASENALRTKLKIGLWNKNNWRKLAEALSPQKNEFLLYYLGETATAIEKWKETLKNKDSHPRLLVFKSLGEIGKIDKTVFPILIKTLIHYDTLNRQFSAIVLGDLGNADKTVITALTRALTNDLEETVRMLAAEALEKLGNADKTVTTALIRALQKDSLLVRRRAAHSLGRLGYADKTVIDALIQAMEDEYLDVRRTAAHSLGELGNADKTVIDALKQAMESKYTDVHEQAAASLVRLGYPDRTMIPLFLESLENGFYGDECLRWMAKVDKTVITAINQTPGHKNFRLKEDDTDAPVISEKTSVTELIEKLKDKGEDFRQQAAASLGTLFRDKSETELMEMLKHPSDGYRTAAAHALVQKISISPQTIEKINHLKDNDKSPWVRLGAWKAFELIQPRLESEKRAKQYMDKGAAHFAKGEFWEAGLRYKKAFYFIEKYIEANGETAAHIKFLQARCTAKLNLTLFTLEYLEDAFKYNPALKERVKNELEKDDSEWTLIKDNWYLKKVLLRGK